MANGANLIDRLIGAVSPAAGVQRLQARAQFNALSGAYKGADRTRDALAGWRIPAGAPDELVARDLPTLRKRAADLNRNNPLAAGAVHTKVQGVVGTGIKYHAAIDREYLGLTDDAADAWEANAERLFHAWAESCDADVRRTANFYEQQEIAFRAVLNAGDHFIQITTAGPSELPFRLALQHITAPRVCNPGNAMDTEALAMGVEKDPQGAPVAYHVLDRHPEAMRRQASAARGTWVRLPAFDSATNRRRTLHLFRCLDADQTRGIPDLAAVI